MQKNARKPELPPSGLDHGSHRSLSPRTRTRVWLSTWFKSPHQVLSKFSKNTRERSDREISLTIFALKNGDDRDRTDDLRLARAALSQLSYIPIGVPDSSPSDRKAGGFGRTRTSDLSLIRAAL